MDETGKLTESAWAELRVLFKALSNAQRSTLVASIAEPGSQIGTSSDSDNYAFLRKLAEFGLAEEISLGIDLPDELGNKLTTFRISENSSALIRSMFDPG